jgi:putative methyltransferase (TIGR04325 family)
MSFRIHQIRLFAKFLSVFGNSNFGTTVIQKTRVKPLLRFGLDGLLGYRRTFSSFSDAQHCASSYIPHGHEHPDEIQAHTRLAEIVRESDYPVLFFLAPLARELRTVFDLGGNVGNLFYAYRQHLDFAMDLLWIVHDLPVKESFGERLAAERGEHRIRFVDTLADASGTDLFIASGSMHYFDSSLDKMLGALAKLPVRVIVNRSPVSRGKDLITVQDNGSYLVPCKLHSEQQLIVGMQALGYKLRASWPVHERSLWVPLYPELSSRQYSGFFFELATEPA